MEQLLLHLVGDYLTQSHWMAVQKVKSTWAASCHALVYSIPFLLIGSPLAVLVILVTHLFMDRFRLAKYVTWAKNQIGPRAEETKWENCKSTGYPEQTPVWLSVWLMIVADNTIHLCINYAALKWM
jgi:hypothetical protein